MQQELRFSFGNNWTHFVEREFNTQRLVTAAQSLRRLLDREHLVGCSFLDIGCGSGLFSLGACLIGAERVVSFDYDPESVSVSEALRSRSGIAASRWTIQQGSVLDQGFLTQLEPADVVYSWGVLHHTGDMWTAIGNILPLVRPSGTLVLALYNRVNRPLTGSQMWWRLKRLYNQSPRLARLGLEVAYAALLIGQTIIRGENPVALVRSYGAGGGRGMHFWYDVRDWMGGFPYEYASVEEVCSFMAGHGFALAQLNRSDGPGCNEFVFTRQSS